MPTSASVVRGRGDVCVCASIRGRHWWQGWEGQPSACHQQEGGLASRPVASTTRWARAATLCPSTSQKSAITCTFSRDTDGGEKNVRWELSDFLQDADLWPGTHSHWQGTHQPDIRTWTRLCKAKLCQSAPASNISPQCTLLQGSKCAENPDKSTLEKGKS